MLESWLLFWAIGLFLVVGFAMSQGAEVVAASVLCALLCFVFGYSLFAIAYFIVEIDYGRAFLICMLGGPILVVGGAVLGVVLAVRN